MRDRNPTKRKSNVTHGLLTPLCGLLKLINNRQKLAILRTKKV